MKLKVELYSDRSLYCYERAAISTALWFNRNFEMMYLDGWDFSIRKDRKTLKIGELMNPGNWNLEDHLHKYHGVRIVKKYFKTENDLFSALISEISASRPVFISEDWLAIGIDVESKMVDVYKINENILTIVPLAVLAEERAREYFIFEVDGAEISPIDPDFVIQHTIQRIQGTTKEKLMFDQMKEYAEIFFVAFDMEAESIGCMNYDDLPIVKNIIEVSRGRRFFRMTLNYIDRFRNGNRFVEIQEKLEVAENKWIFIMSLLTKSFYLSSIEKSTKLKVYQNIKETADLEKGIFQSLSGC